MTATTTPWVQGRPIDNPQDPNGLSIAAAAREGGIHYQTIRNWLAAGKIGASRFGPSGGIVRIHRDDLAAAMRGEPPATPAELTTPATPE